MGVKLKASLRFSKLRSHQQLWTVVQLIRGPLVGIYLVVMHRLSDRPSQLFH